MGIYDVKKVATICREQGALSVFDNTLSTPLLLNPLDLGVDIVVHSSSKLIGGHSDIIVGSICTNNEVLYKRLKEIYNRTLCLPPTLELGMCPSPIDCYLLLRGIKTLAIRMERAQENAQKMAEYLAKHPKIAEVIYPGLKTHKGYELHHAQCRGAGYILSFKLKDWYGALRLVKRPGDDR
jgi:cystathionine beta-lyase/cystathionine gamma-synthase